MSIYRRMLIAASQAVDSALDWVFNRTLNNPNPVGTTASDWYGFDSVGVNEQYAIVGGDSEDVGASNSGLAYIFNLNDGTLKYTLVNPNVSGTGDNDSFGSDVSLSTNYAAVAARLEDLGGSNSGQIYIFNLSDGSLKYSKTNPNAFDTPASDFFGSKIAVTETHFAASAPEEDDIDGTSSGAVYLFSMATGNLLYDFDNPNAFGSSLNDRFGYSMALSDNYLIVGAPNEDDANVESGYVYIYDVSTGALLHGIANPNFRNTTLSDNFGISVGISDNYAIVGAYREDSATGSDAGIAYVFDPSTGALLHTLENPNATANDYFGMYADCSNDYGIVSAYREIDDDGGTLSGKAYIFDLSDGSLVKTLDNPNQFGTSAGDEFGRGVAISAGWAIVGGREEGIDGGGDSGIAHTFKLGEPEPLADPTSITISGSATMDAGDTNQLAYTILPTGARDDVTWSLSSSTYFSITQDGLLTSTDSNTARSVTVYATTDNSIQDSLIVTTVGPQQPTSVTLIGQGDMDAGGQQQITYALSPIDAIDDGLTWSLSSTAYFSITQDGLLTSEYPTSTRSVTVYGETSNGHTDSLAVTATYTAGGQVFTYVNSAAVQGNTLAIPGNIQAGDVAFAYGMNYSNVLSSFEDDTFTQIVSEQYSTYHSQTVGYRVLTSADANRVIDITDSGNYDAISIIVFRPSILGPVTILDLQSTQFAATGVTTTIPAATPCVYLSFNAAVASVVSAVDAPFIEAAASSKVITSYDIKTSSNSQTSKHSQATGTFQQDVALVFTVGIPQGITESLISIPAADSSVWTQRTTSVADYIGKQARLVIKYTKGSSFTGDIQLDDFSLGGTIWDTDAGTNGFETSTADTTHTTYSSVPSWGALITARSGEGLFLRDTGGTPSSSTGTLTTGNTGSYYIYAETSGGTASDIFWLRSPIVTINSSTLSFYSAQSGATCGGIEVYLEVI